MKAPNSKLQAPEKLQVPNPNERPPARKWILVVWNFSGAWMLALGAFHPSSLRQKIIFLSY
jgi:hypothetical protein